MTRTTTATACANVERTTDAIDNEQIAGLLEEVAALLEGQHANPFRVAAYRRGAAAVRALPGAVAQVAAGGAGELMASLGVGSRLARVITELVATGRIALLDRLRGETDPTLLLSTVPGIGLVLADRIHREFGIETLDDLEAAAHDGRLAAMRGIGRWRLAAIQEALAQRLGRRRRLDLAGRSNAWTIAELLDVDREYREAAAAGRLRRIAPRRFNPGKVAWLPILHTERGDRHYTALFSNTARAHEAGRTGDWVVIYRDDDGADHQATVVTETHGPLDGLRVVRGREHESAEYYANAAKQERHT